MPYAVLFCTMSCSVLKIGPLWGRFYYSHLYMRDRGAEKLGLGALGTDFMEYSVEIQMEKDVSCCWPPYFTSCSADLGLSKLEHPQSCPWGNIWLFSSDPRGVYFLVYSLFHLQRPGSAMCKGLTRYAFGFRALAVTHFPWLMATYGWGLEVMEDEPIFGELGTPGCGIWLLMNKPATVVCPTVDLGMKGW